MASQMSERRPQSSPDSSMRTHPSIVPLVAEVRKLRMAVVEERGVAADGRF